MSSFKQILQKRHRKQQGYAMIGNGHSPFDILIEPLMTEKSYALSSSDQKNVSRVYMFKVHKNANKNDIKYAFHYIYNIIPKKVRTMIVADKYRAQRGRVRRSFKKGIIILPKGKKIELS